MKSPIIHKIQSLIKTINLNYLIILNNLSILNINLFIFLVFIVYYFVCGLNFYGLIVFSVSLIISLYVFYHYTYNQIFKSFLIYSVLFIISLFFISSLIVKFELISLDDIPQLVSEGGYTNIKISSNNGMNSISTSTNILPNVGAGVAGGALGAVVIKGSAGFPFLQRIGAAGVTTLVGATSANLVLGIGARVLNNVITHEILKHSMQSNKGQSRVFSLEILPYTTPREQPNISNIDVSPLEELLRYSYAINLLILVLLCSLIILLVNRYVLHGNLNYIISFLEKYFPNKYIPTLKGKINKGMNYNNKFILLVLTINGILLFILLFLNIFVTGELVVNIDSYVTVYNIVHSNKSVILIIGCPKFIKIKGTV